MSQIHFNLKTLNNVIVSHIIVFSLMGCGGGGSDSSQESSAAPIEQITAVTTAIIAIPISVDYTPDSDKLSSVATSSTELFVDPNFTFNSHKVVNFDIGVTDVNNKPMSNMMLSISLIDNDIVEYDDPRLQEKSFIAKVNTNNNGQVYLSIELPIRVAKVLLELNTVGMENDVIVSLDNSDTVIYHFQQQL